MKSHLLLAMAIVLPISLYAETSFDRIGAISLGSAKQINTQGHIIRHGNLPMHELGEAPANTVEVPFTHDLGKGGTEVSNYIDINVNGDNRTWKYHTVSGYAACMPPNADGIDANDDWLITVPVHMPAGNYVVSFEVGMMGSGALAVEFDAWLFNEASIEGKLAEITPSTRHTAKDFTLYEYNCAIPTEGYYYIGVHCTTAAVDKGTIKLANLGVRQGTVNPPVEVDPPAAGTLTYQLAPKGELKATLTYVVPNKTIGGEDLSSISKVELTSRWTVDKFYFYDVVPGETIVQDVPMYAGFNNRFTATAYVDDVAGETVEIKNIFCGPDSPLPPSDVKLTVNEGYRSATLTWSAPGEIGEHGGYVDTEQLTYYIFDAFGSYYDPALYVTDQTSLTIDYTDIDGQDFFAYQVTAGIGDTYSLDATSEIIVAGMPGQMPFGESFGGGRYDGVWAISPETTGSATQNWGTITDDYFASLFDPDDPDAPMPLTSQDGDGGFYYWLPYDNSAVFGLTSVRTDIASASNPVLEFWYQGQGSMIDVLIAGGAGSLQHARAINLKEDPTTGWTLARIPLDAYREQGAVMFEIRLSAVHNDDTHTWSVPLDNIRVRDLADVDLHIVKAVIPGQSSPDSPLICSAYVENRGTEAATSASASLIVNGEVVETKVLEPIESDAFTEVELAYLVPLNAPEVLQISIQFDIEGDPLIIDNSVEATVAVVRRNYATVTDLSATVNDGKVELSWTAPVNDASEAALITEDFESDDYAPMSISGAGEWTVYDGDGKKTYNIFRETVNPYQTQPIAFQLFNRTVAQVPVTYWEDAAAHSGETFMLAPSAQSAANDNWLISPELSGNAQTITFWAKSYTVAWPETMEVYYSTADNSPQAFINKLEVSGEWVSGKYVPETWTQYSVALPAGATYFAIRHNSYDTLALFIDDVTYEGKPKVPVDLVIEGYYVFRDGRQLTPEPLTETGYTDSPIAADTPDGLYNFRYTVVPVYNYGPVVESNYVEVAIQYAGLEQIDIGSLNDNERVYDLNGRSIDHRNIVPGIYIVVEGADARKVQLR